MMIRKLAITLLVASFGFSGARAGAVATRTDAHQQAEPAPAQAPTVAERVGALKQSLIESKAALKGYEWIETTVVFLKGEEKSSVQKRCYHGADGKVQKIAIETPPEPKSKPGIRGKVIAKKKGELTDYMKQAIELVHQYVPPDPEAIQKAKDAGKASIAILDPGKRIRLDFKDYLFPGDEFRTEVTLTDNRLASIAVSTHLDDKSTNKEEKDPIGLDIRMGALEDGTTYAEETTLEAKANELKVVISNSGYRKITK